MLFHHDPLHSDDFLDAFHETAVERWSQMGGRAETIEMAAERKELRVGAPRQVPAAARA
jgi:hypothetical protein